MNINNKLTPKQQKFIEEVASGKSQSDAYRAAYNVGRMSAASIAKEASKLLANPHITPMLQQLRAQVTVRLRYDTEEAMQQAQQAFVLAMQLGQPSAAVGAVTLKAKLMGLLTQDRKNDHTPLMDLTDDELDALIESLEAERKRLGIRH